MSAHLAVMKRVCLAVNERRSRSIIYTGGPEPSAELIVFLLEEPEANPPASISVKKIFKNNNLKRSLCLLTSVGVDWYPLKVGSC